MADTIRDSGRVEPTLGSASKRAASSAPHADFRLPESKSDRGGVVSFFRRKPKPAPAADEIRRDPQIEGRQKAPLAPRAERAAQPPPRSKARPVRQADPELEIPRRAKAPTARRSLWMSPITRRILLLNVMALAIPVFGLLYLPTYRDSLIQTELELLKTEGELFSGALAASGVVTDPDGSERLQPDTSRQTIRRLVDVSKTRARLFLPTGTLIADSFLLSGPGGILLIEPLPPPEPPEGPILQALGGAYDWLLGRFPASDLYPPYGESAVQVAGDYQEVKQALDGETGTFVRSGGDGSLVL